MIFVRNLSPLLSIIKRKGGVLMISMKLEAPTSTKQVRVLHVRTDVILLGTYSEPTKERLVDRGDISNRNALESQFL